MNYEITQELAKSGHQLAVLLGTQHGMLDASSLVQRMAGQLEVLAAVLREKTKRSDALAAENAALNSERLAWAELYSDEMGDPDILDKAKAFKAPASSQLSIEESQFLTDVLTAAGLLSCGKQDKGLARKITDFCVSKRGNSDPAQLRQGGAA